MAMREIGRYYWIKVSDGDIEALQAAASSMKGWNDYRDRLNEAVKRSLVARFSVSVTKRKQARKQARKAA
jgi:hypothetical protein